LTDQENISQAADSAVTDAPADTATADTAREQGSVPPSDFDGGSGPDRGAVRADLEMLRDVELRVTAELGRAKMTLGEITSLTGGSIVTLNKAAGEPVDLRINDQMFASGEVIVMDGYFAVKITKLLSKEERVKNFS